MFQSLYLIIVILQSIFTIPIMNCFDDPLWSNPALNEASIYDYIEEDIFFEVIYPEEISYTYRLHRARDFGIPFDHQLKGVRLVLSDPLECCSLPHNAPELHGAVVLVSRGDCSFVSKAIKAEEAGALAIIVTDNNTENDDLYIEMIDDSTHRHPKIPAAFLLGKSGYIIARTLILANEEAAIINIPVNLTTVPVHKLNQPPWIVW